MSRHGRTSLGGHRLVSGYLIALALPGLVMIVVAALVGGLGPALVSAITSSMLLNYFFTPPLHTLSVTDPNTALALAIFVAVAMLVSSAVDLAARRQPRQRSRLCAAWTSTSSKLTGTNWSSPRTSRSTGSPD